MRYYPVNLDIRGRECLVVGGGTVGRRKLARLLECGAQVTVVSPVISDEIRILARDNPIEIKERDYFPSDLDGVFLVIGATDNEEVNTLVSRDATERSVLCNIVDRPEECSFVLPAIMKQGDLLVAISTSGKSPAFARSLRLKLTKELGPEYGRLLDIMGAVRRKMMRAGNSPEANKHIFERLIDADLLGLIKEEDTTRINTLLKKIAGDGFALKDLFDSNEIVGKEILL